MSKVMQYYLMNNTAALNEMQEVQAELSRLSDNWDKADGAPEVSQEYIDKWQDEHKTDEDEAPPF